MNGYGWAGTTLKIERISGSASGAPTHSSKQTEDTKALLRRVLENRYNFETKFLDLSALGKDAELRKEQVFEQTSNPAKILAAMLKVLELSFDKPEEMYAAILSVSLASNDLTDVSPVNHVSITLPKLRNLDLSNNNIGTVSALQSWRHRFHNLEYLILLGNPIEQKEPDYPKEIIKWYPNLRVLNNLQVRNEEDIKNRSSATALPFPPQAPLFQDEGGIVANFICTFFAGFDSDRAALAAHYFDDQSEFSFAINTQAPRDPTGSEHIGKQEWEMYIKNSRNLKKISQLPARQNRHFRGPNSVAEIFAALPKTKHPNLTSDAEKWMIEAHIQPGVPDPSGQSVTGVDGFMITMSGEYEELDEASGVAKKKRSFDRTFIIGPGGPSGVRIVSDMLTVRAYGGFQAFQTKTRDMAQVPPTNATATPSLPPGLSIEMAEQMVNEMQRQTSMTLPYAKDCLDQMGWDFQKGLEVFASVKASLPAEAFVQVS